MQMAIVIFGSTLEDVISNFDPFQGAAARARWIWGRNFHGL